MNVGAIYKPEQLHLKLEKLRIINEEEDTSFDDSLFVRTLLNNIDHDATYVVLPGCDVSRLLSLERKYLG